MVLVSVSVFVFRSSPRIVIRFAVQGHSVRSQSPEGRQTKRIELCDRGQLHKC